MKSVLNTVENIAAKWEISHYEDFLFLSIFFQKSFAADVSKWEKRTVIYNKIADFTSILFDHNIWSTAGLTSVQFMQNIQRVIILAFYRQWTQIYIINDVASVK